MGIFDWFKREEPQMGLQYEYRCSEDMDQATLSAAMDEMGEWSFYRVDAAGKAWFRRLLDEPTADLRPRTIFAVPKDSGIQGDDDD